MSVAETLKKPPPRFHWKCKHTWRRSAKNTAWCLLGCSIGDFGTILYFQLTGIPWPTPVSYTHLRAHETLRYLVCRLLLEKKKN